MSEEQTTHQGGAQTVTHERCLCREVLEQVRQHLTVSPEVSEHFTNSRVEFLKGIRAIIDSRIEHLSKTGERGTKVTVE
jgi:hypothetical protein